MIEAVANADALVRAGALRRPTALCRPARAQDAARQFLTGFQGSVLYAVKANPAPWLLTAVHQAGVRWFDVASETEFEAVDGLEGRVLAFMNPVKSRRAIARAYYDFGCRVFAVDCLDELEKLRAETGFAQDLTVVVRCAVSNADAVLPLDGKYGVSTQDAAALLVAARKVAARLGVAFHVGSQCMNPAAFTQACEHVTNLAVNAGVRLDVLNVGGGFPCAYPGLTPPALPEYFAAIDEAVARAADRLGGVEAWCEPGRALGADAESLVVQVDLRKGDALYISDGGFGHLYDAAHEAWRFPMRLVRPDAPSTAPLHAFRLYGPTCDSADFMPGPFMLPADVREGDAIEIGGVGAYGRTMRAPFNGFGAFDERLAEDAPFYLEVPARESVTT